MTTYALRCPETALSDLIAAGVTAGIIIQDDQGAITAQNNGAWDDIGFRRVGPPPDEGVPDTRPLLSDENDVPYRHINLRTDADISALDNYILRDLNGAPLWPNFPMRVFL